MRAEDVWRVYCVPICLGIISLLFISLSITIFIKSYQQSEPISFSSDVASKSAEISEMTIDIEGAVEHPGVYRLPMGARVDDAIAKAGGFIRNTDLEMVSKTMNRAAKLSDGAKLYIPSKNDSPSSPNAPIFQSSLMNINSASASELDTVSGVGAVTAQKIIAGRPYMRLEELVEKKIMSQSLFIKLKDQLSL